MSSSQVSWSSAFWVLVALATNTMFQSSSGRICGMNAQISTYLRSSPIICGLDAVSMLLRFGWHCYRLVHDRLSVLKAMPYSARIVLDSRSSSHEQHEAVELRSQQGSVEMRTRHEEAEARSQYEPDWRIAMGMFAFAVGCLLQFLKLMAYQGIPWSQIWACCYMSAFAVQAILSGLARFADAKERESVSRTRSNIYHRASIVEIVLTVAAVLLQLVVLAHVDLAGFPPDKSISRRWAYRGIRLSGHFTVLLIHVPFIMLEYQGQNSILNLEPELRKGLVVLSMLLLNILQSIMHGLNLRYSHMYHMWSVIISSFSWMLYYIPITRRSILGCLDNEGNGYLNVLAFDFFLRIICFSVFWYVWHYNPAGTYMPSWTSYLGN